MKQSFFIALLALSISLNGHGQSCLPNGISFTTQAQVDNFSVNYPGCTSIEGNVFISGGLNNLNGLSNLASIGGDLTIFQGAGFTSLQGLNSLTFIGGDLIIQITSLINLNGLQGLTSVGKSVLIGSNSFYANNSLTSLNGLNNLNTIGAGLYISANPILANLSDLSNLQSVQQVVISDSPGLNNLNGLEGITNVKGLTIQGNQTISNLNGLQNLNTVDGNLSISGNAVLTDFSALQNLTAVNGGLNIGTTQTLTDLSPFSNLQTLGSLSIFHNASLVNLNGLENITALAILDVWNNPNLQNLDGLTNLTNLAGLYLQQNNQLNSLNALAGADISGRLSIYSNPLLVDFTGLQGTHSLQELTIAYNNALQSLNGLENINSISEGLSITSNPVLTSLSGLSGLSSLGGSLRADGNQSLTDCSILGICAFLAQGPDTLNISNNAPGCNTETEVSSLCGGSDVTVEVLVDENANCSSGLPVADVPVRFKGGVQNTLKPTAADGLAKFRYFDTQPFQITLPQLSDGHWNVCEVRQNYVASNGDDSTHVSLFLSPKVNCPELNVKLNLPTNFRGCLVNSEMQVTAQNNGDLLAEGGKIAIVMPPVFELLNTEPLMSGQNGDTLYFEIGDLKPFETADVKLTVITKCDTFLMGQTLCWEAFAAMDNPCPEIPVGFSEIKLSAKCVGDTIVRLGLKNIGDAPTQAWHEYKIIRNELVEYNNAFNLNPQESLSFDFPADGATWRMEATKLNDGTQTAIALENCGGLTPGLITAFWLDHGPVEYDFDCRQVVQAYDPNRKTALPAGVGSEHIISNTQPIYYTIEFQNTGTDTAFRVQLIDKLSDYLDVNTFKLEGASHPCIWEIRSDKLEVLFLPIALPDSNVNEPASHGYFSFSISPKSNLTEGTQIYNFAQIIFDFNWPIWTNWVYHSIGRLTVSVDEAQAQGHLWQILGNPTRDVAIFRSESFLAGEKRFELFDAAGRVLRSAEFSGQEFEFQRDMLPGGLYFFRISDARHRVFTGKIVVAE